MKRRNFLWTVLLMVFLLYGCTYRIQLEPAENREIQPATNETTPIETEEEEYPEVVECAVAEGFVTPESVNSNTPCRIRLNKYRVDKDLTNGFIYESYIEIDTGTKVLKKELMSGGFPFPADSILLGDVDGDGIQEIFIHSNTGGCGGAGSWLAEILRVEGNEIFRIFGNWNEFDTGFESRFLDGYQLEVKNHITGYNLVFGVTQSHRDYIADAKELPAGNIMVDSFYGFEPTDVDGDGISEVICKQYTSILSHADYTGTACSVLKFNTETQAFEVVDAWYEPYTEE